MVKRKNNIHEVINMGKGKDRADYINTFKCDNCGKIINRADTVFTETSYGGRAWLCYPCADSSQVSMTSSEVANDNEIVEQIKRNRSYDNGGPRK